MTFFKETMRGVPLDNKTVLVRMGYDVPLKKDGSIADDYRITSSFPTLQNLLDRGCKVVIIAHLGRPEGRDKAFSLEVVSEYLKNTLSVPVLFVDECVGDKARLVIKKAPKKSVVVLENLRFYDGEKANDALFAKQLARDSGASYFVQDAFSNAHREDASMNAVTMYLPSVAGLLLEKEYVMITDTMKHPKHPLVAVLGGAKVSDKIGVIEALESIADTILIGGAMANTFLAAKGVPVGKSKSETDQDKEVQKIYDLATRKVGAGNESNFLILPSDVAVAHSPDEKAVRKIVSINEIDPDDMALDIGDATIDSFVSAIESAETVIWNGTLGFAELPEFAHGSARVALALATHPNIISIIGGGDTADFVLHWDSKKGGSFTHVSTGGGASLELMAGKKLPGVESLLDARG